MKPMRSRMRIVMTGAPVEKNLIELWSVFDFLNRGLLGTQSEFRNFFMHIRENPLQHAPIPKNIRILFIMQKETRFARQLLKCPVLWNASIP